MKEPLPLARIHDAILEFLKGRDDAVLCGAPAVNAYLSDVRMSADVYVVSTQAEELPRQLRDYLHTKFRLALRVRQVAGGKGLRVYQVRKPSNRRLVDNRAVDVLPPARRVKGVPVQSPPTLIASKVVAFVQRQGHPKSYTEPGDLAYSLLAFPEFKVESGPVLDRLAARTSDPRIFDAWRQIVNEPIPIPEAEAY